MCCGRKPCHYEDNEQSGSHAILHHVADVAGRDRRIVAPTASTNPALRDIVPNGLRKRIAFAVADRGRIFRSIAEFALDLASTSALRPILRYKPTMLQIS
jgi:hypothetical protein